MIQDINQSVNTPDPIDLNMGQLAVLILAIHSPCRSRLWMATKLHMSKRMVAYHLAALHRKGFLQRTRRFDPCNGGPIIELPGKAIGRCVAGVIPRRLPNRWTWNENIAPFVVFLRRGGRETLYKTLRRRTKSTKGAMRHVRLAVMVISLLDDLAARLKVRLPKVLTEFYQRLRKLYYLGSRPMQSLDERREYYLRSPPTTTLAQRKAYYLGR